MTKNRTLPLVECAIMIALATVLSMVKLAELPYGGSITIASMLPIAIIAYRRGMGWGLGSAFVYAVIQQLLGLNSLSYVTTWQSVVAVILLDYIVAFTVVGFAGIFRNAIKSQAAALTLGCVCIRPPLCLPCDFRCNGLGRIVHPYAGGTFLFVHI